MDDAAPIAAGGSHPTVEPVVVIRKAGRARRIGCDPDEDTPDAAEWVSRLTAIGGSVEVTVEGRLRQVACSARRLHTSGNPVSSTRNATTPTLVSVLLRRRAPTVDGTWEGGAALRWLRPGRRSLNQALSESRPDPFDNLVEGFVERRRCLET